MKRLFHFSILLLESPIFNLFLAVMFLYGGIGEAIDDYNAKKSGVSVHHGIALYGIILFVKSFVASLKVVKGFYKNKWTTSES